MLSALLLLCACAEEQDPEIKADLDSAISAANAETRLSAEYMLEITFGNGTVLYYAMGDAAWDRTEKNANAFFDQTYLGSSVEMENYFSDGKMVSVENGNPIEVERDGDILMTKFPYFTPVSDDENPDIALSNNLSGTAYTFTRGDTRELCESILGGDIYALATVIKKPQKELTQYGNTKCVYTVSDGRLVSCRYEFDIKLFDTPAGNANYTPPESEYTLDLHVVAKLSYEGFGESVSVEEYSADE